MRELKFRVPLDGDIVINSSYKIRKDPKTKELKLHSGIDYKAKEGTKVFASESGEVIRVSEHRAFGKLIIIDHAPLAKKGGRHIYTLYAHLSEMRPDLGEYVLKGEIIGRSGGEPDKSKSKEEQTSTGPHLHFGVYDSKTALKWRTEGGTGVFPYHSDDPNWYINIRHSVDGAILDINDLNEKIKKKVGRVMELKTTKKVRGLERSFRSEVFVDGKHWGYLGTRKLELVKRFTPDEAIAFLRKPMKEYERDEYVVYL